MTVNYESTRDINATLTTRLEGGNPPDVAGLPGPGAMAQFARSGDVLALDDVIDQDAMAQEWNEGLISDSKVDGHMVGVFIKVSPKGFIWYNPQQFEAKSYEVPEDFDGLNALVEKIKSDGTTPWGIGLNSGAGPRAGPAPTGSRTSSCASPVQTCMTPGGRARRNGARRDQGGLPGIREVVQLAPS